jgi:hypothetical protein
MGHDLEIGIVQANQLDIGHAGETAQIGSIIEGIPVARTHGRYTHAQATPLTHRTLDRPLKLSG